MEFSILGLLNSPEFQLLISTFLVPLAVNSVSERLKALKAAIKGKTHEEQLLDCLEKAFFDTERALHRKHNTEAIYETFMGSLMSFSNTFNKDSLAKIFKDAFGEDVTDDEISLWIDNLYKQITIEEHNELFKYLLLKNIISDKPSPQPQVSLDYLLTYTTPVWDNKDVICRDDIIEELFGKFSKGVRRIQVAGMGGLGKTELLAKLFFQLNQPNPPVQFDYIGFIQFKGDLEADFRLHIPYLAEYAKNHGESAAKLFLQQLCATNRVLLCIDDDRNRKNVLTKNDPNIAFLKTLSASILFASRTAYAEFEQQDLPLLSTDACIEIFQSIYDHDIHDPRDLEILTKIIEDISGNNTLIVNRLGNMSNENSFSIGELQKNLQEKGFRIKKDCINEDELQQEINKLYPLSDLTKDGTRSIVEAFSIFPVNPLPIDLCVDWLHEDAGIDATECARVLTRLSKQTWLEKRIDASNGEVLFSMHQCVKSAVKDQTIVEYSAHHKLVKACASSLSDSISAYLFVNASIIIPYATTILESLPDELLPLAELSSVSGRYYYESGDLSTALKWYRKELFIKEKVSGKEHPYTASAYNNIASVYYSQCHYDLALEWFQKALKIYERVLGKEHPSTATAYNNIAGVCDSQGQYDLALEWYQEALVIYEKALGVDHPSTATTYNNIASVYSSLGQYDLALEWYYKDLAINEKVLGKDHPNAATSYNNIALVYQHQGRYDLALEWYQKALLICEKVFGKEHPTTATTYNNAALVYQHQGRYDLALEWYQKALVIHEKVLGKEHPDTAVTYNNIAGVYKNQGQFELALEWYLKDLAISEKVLGIDHPDTAINYNNTAMVYYHLGEYNQALGYFRKALNVFETKLGQDHPYTTNTREAVSDLEKLV